MLQKSEAPRLVLVVTVSILKDTKIGQRTNEGGLPSLQGIKKLFINRVRQEPFAAEGSGASCLSHVACRMIYTTARALQAVNSSSLSLPHVSYLYLPPLPRALGGEALLYQAIEGEQNVDWSAVRSHKRERRKYGPRTHSSTSSRSSVSSGLTEQFSSSSSDTAGEVSGVGSAPKTKDTCSTGLFGAARQIWVKRKAEKLFHRFTTKSRRKHQIQAWKRRRDAAEALIQIVSTESDGENIIAHTFVQTDSRQETGVQAILALGADECDAFEVNSADEDLGLPQPHPPDEPGDIALQASDTAARLLNLVIFHSKGSRFFQETIPAILRVERSPEAIQASAAIPYLATAFPIQFDLIGPTLIQDFGSWLVRVHQYPSLKWLRGIRILDIILNRVSRNGPRQRKMKLLVAHQVLQVVTQVIIAQDQDSSQSLMTKRHELSITLPLRAALSAILQTENTPEALDNILPPRHTLSAFTRALGHICTSLNMEACLAVRLLALMRDIPEVRNALSTAHIDGLADACLRFVFDLDREEVKSFKTADFELQRLTPDEDAFDVLCYLLELEFARALESRLEMFIPLGSGLAYRLAFLQLEPLLWLSNMPPHVKIAHLSASWEWFDREDWRAKGQAMMCLGNIIERMDEAQMRDYLTEDMIDSVLDIKMNEEAPLSERDHATFTLQRYMAAAHRCGIEPYYGDEMQASG
ncbi:hypothetical protein FS837_011169 [Tulasnella sp. UAMH 9824]|nr:hypothetical protein FS837_011169 [Tulasnella sp. UAMH 9824]